MSDKKTAVEGIERDDIPELVAGARFASASSLDAFIDEVFGAPETPVDIRAKAAHIN